MDLSQREILSADLAPHLVGLELEVDLLAFSETCKTSPLDRADVNEHIVAAVVRLNESKALLAVKPLYSTCRHFLLQSAYAQVPRDRHAEQILFVDVYGKGARGRIQQGTAAERTALRYTSPSILARLQRDLIGPVAFTEPLRV